MDSLAGDNREKAYKLFKISRILVVVMIIMLLIYASVLFYIVFNTKLFLHVNLITVFSLIIGFAIFIGIINFVMQFLRSKAVSMYTGRNIRDLSRNEIYTTVKELRRYKNN